MGGAGGVFRSAGAGGMGVYPPGQHAATADLLVWGTNVNIVRVEEQFNDFLHSYCALGESEPLYIRLIHRMVNTRVPFINLDCEHLHSYDPELYQHLVNYPGEILPIFDKVLGALTDELSCGYVALRLEEAVPQLHGCVRCWQGW